MHRPLPNLVVADTTAPLSHFSKNGYYRVGNKAFNHKVPALQEASRTRTNPTWVFNDDVFSTVDWAQPLNVPLLELYRLRALQLREQYDYLMIGFSGGADSDTMLHAFLDNNIKLDEVVILWPKSFSQGRYTPVANRDMHNFVSEWDFVIKPKIDWLRANYPELNVNVVDAVFDASISDAEDNVMLVEKHNYITISRYRQLDNILRSRTEKYKNVGYAIGFSPPNLVIRNNELYTNFPDSHTSPATKSDYVFRQGWVRNIEYFYWTPDMPEIVREQCHVLLQVMNTVPNFRNLCKHENLVGQVVSWPDYNIVRQVRKPYLYPNYPLNNLQVDKPDNVLTNIEWHRWFFDNNHSLEFLDPFNSAVKAQQALIDQRFYVTANHDNDRRNQGIIDYKTFDSRYYRIGTLTEIY